MTSLETKRLFDADLKGLLEYIQSGGHRKELSEYARVLLNFLTGRSTELRECVSRLERLAEQEGSQFFSMLTHLGYLRIELLDGSLNLSSVEELLKIDAKDSIWGAEILFVAAMGFEKCGRYDEALKYYSQSAIQWNRFGCEKREILSRLSALISESRIFPSRRFLVEYHFVHQKALSLGADGVAGVALGNISQEYHFMGALSLALKTANRAIELLDCEFGSRQYFLALLHRCDVLLDLNRKEEALLDFQKASISEFKEVKAAIEVLNLREKLNSKIKKQDIEELLPAWQQKAERLSDQRWIDRKKLAGLEEEFVKITSSGPLNKHDIIISLYGKNIDYSSAEGRFKNLLVRMKKKYPGLIIFEDGKYGISDHTVLVGTRNKDRNHSVS